MTDEMERLSKVKALHGCPIRDCPSDEDVPRVGTRMSHYQKFIEFECPKCHRLILLEVA